MKKPKTFSKGGVHPHGNKNFTCGKPIQEASISELFVIPLSQHLGSPAECVVETGNKITEGMLLGKASGFISSCIHSPIAGNVKEIRDIFLPSGIKSEAVVIETLEDFNGSESYSGKIDWNKLPKDQILDKIAEMGIVGMGGATFPVNVKLMVKEDAEVDFFVINAVECEPYLTADHRIMLEKTAEIIEGIAIINKIIQPKAIVIGIELNKPDAIEVMEKAAAESDLPITVIPLKLKYPQGDEKQLLKAVTGREVPSGALPMEIGAIVSNVGTVNAVYEAVVFNKPLTKRVVTVSGGAIKEPGNLNVMIGTSIGSVIEECGGFSETPAKIVVGGPMMGFSVYDLDTPVTKGTSGILALTKKEVNANIESTCLECGRCVKACPMGINPTRLYKLIDHIYYDTAVKEGLLDCKECGCCSFSCPSYIPLVHGMKLGKVFARKRAHK